MKTLIRTALFATAGLVVACGDNQLAQRPQNNATQKQTTHDPSVPTEETETTPSRDPLTSYEVPAKQMNATPTGAIRSTNATLRIKGSDLNDVTSFMTSVQSVEMTANGQPVPLTLTKQPVDLANTSQSWLVASFTLPSDATTVQVTMRLGDGLWSGTGDAGSFNAHDGVPIRFESPVENIAKQGKLVVDVELVSSMAKTATDGTLLLPHYVLRY